MFRCAPLFDGQRGREQCLQPCAGLFVAAFSASSAAASTHWESIEKADDSAKYLRQQESETQKAVEGPAPTIGRLT